MYKTRKNVVLGLVTFISIITFLAMSILLLPDRSSSSLPVVTGVVVLMNFAIIVFWANRARNVLLSKVGMTLWKLEKL